MKTSLRVYAKKEEKPVFIKVVTEHSNSLTYDQFGNYAVQVGMENWPKEECQGIFKELSLDLAELSIQKFSSNVIERVMEKGQMPVVLEYIDILLDGDNLEYVAASYYGFYVLERILNLLKQGD